MESTVRRKREVQLTLVVQRAPTSFIELTLQCLGVNCLFVTALDFLRVLHLSQVPYVFRVFLEGWRDGLAV